MCVRIKVFPLSFSLSSVGDELLVCDPRVSISVSTYYTEFSHTVILF